MRKLLAAPNPLLTRKLSVDGRNVTSFMTALECRYLDFTSSIRARRGRT